jgi:hypothetical protein
VVAPLIWAGLPSAGLLYYLSSIRCCSNRCCSNLASARPPQMEDATRGSLSFVASFQAIRPEWSPPLWVTYGTVCNSQTNSFNKFQGNI